jgi:hypothetical protein
MQVQIKFTARGSSQITGNFAPGDLLRCSAEHARHLVEDARCAVYVAAPVQAAPENRDAARKPRARKE